MIAYLQHQLDKPAAQIATYKGRELTSHEQEELRRLKVQHKSFKDYLRVEKLKAKKIDYWS